MLIAVEIVTALLVIATALPFLPLAHGLVRVGDFPRQQIMFLALATLLVSVAFGDDRTAFLVCQILLAAAALTQAACIAPYTMLWRRETADHTGEPGAAFRLIASNVKMGNRRYADFVRTIGREKADFLILMEVDEGWMQGLAPLLDEFDHVIALPQPNAYGMALASRHPLSDVSTACLLTEGVPSIVATVELSQAQRFRLYCIHPEPPVPHRGSEGRDGETALVALAAREETLPVLVSGDLNDVAWSGTTRRFRRISRLLDPRIGRAVFSTFDARYPFIRWPLDHLFHSAEFRLKDMRRLDSCGSDHFPVLFDMVLCETERAESRPEHADGDDIERAEDLVEQAAKRNEPPIGKDWEN